MDTLEDAEVMTAVVDAGSISAAARKRGMSQPALSRAVARVEARLGVTLLDRSSRTLRVTDAGACFLEGARRLLRDARALEAATAAVGGRFGGVLRLSLPPALARKRLLRGVLAFSAKHPDVRLEVRLEARLVDLIVDDVDVAVRLGALPDSGLLGRRLGSYAHLVVASPAYLRRHGEPSDPKELLRHSLLGMKTVGPNTTWPFAKGRTKRVVEVTPSFVTNDGEALIAAATFGLGITVASDFLCEDELRAGSLVRVFEGWSMPSAPITALTTRATAATPAVRALLASLSGASRRREHG